MDNTLLDRRANALRLAQIATVTKYGGHVNFSSWDELTEISREEIRTAVRATDSPLLEELRRREAAGEPVTYESIYLLFEDPKNDL